MWGRVGGRGTPGQTGRSLTDESQTLEPNHRLVAGQIFSRSSFQHCVMVKRIDFKPKHTCIPILAVLLIKCITLCKLLFLSVASFFSYL